MSEPSFTLIDVDIAVIGGGPAGMAAALSAHKDGAEVSPVRTNSVQ